MKRKVYLFLLLMCVMLMAGCGREKQAENDTDISIIDGAVETRLSVPAGLTVSDILGEAELTLGSDDEISPALDTAITKDSQITINRSVTVTVDRDKKPETLTMKGGLVKDALEKSGITLGKHDLVNHDLNAYLKEDMDIKVVHQVEVTVTHDGKSETTITSARTVKALLKEMGIKLSKADRLSCKKSKKLKENDKIVIQRVTYKEIKETESIPYTTKTKNNSSMKKGKTKVVQKGQNGTKEITYKVTYVDGKEESREETGSKVIKKPKEKIVEKGTKAEKKKKSKNKVVKSWKEEECDGTIIWHYKYANGKTKIVVK